MVGFKKYRMIYKIHVEEHDFSEVYRKQTEAHVCSRIRTDSHRNLLSMIMRSLQNKTHYTYSVIIFYSNQDASIISAINI